MQKGYIFLCNTDAINECLKRKRFSCAYEQSATSRVEENDIVFLFNDKTGTLVGPFTAGTAPSKDLEKGAWYSSVEKNQFSENIMVTWESVHELKNAPDIALFLKDIRSCPLSALWTQELLTALKQAPLYTEESTEPKP
jgi:hypothetical protein